MLRKTLSPTWTWTKGLSIGHTLTGTPSRRQQINPRQSAAVPLNCLIIELLGNLKQVLAMQSKANRFLHFYFKVLKQFKQVTKNKVFSKDI